MKFIKKNAGHLQSVRNCTLLGVTLAVIGALVETPEASAQWPQVVSLPPCQGSGQVVAVDLSTGTTNGIKNSLGSNDKKWHLTQQGTLQGKWNAYSIGSLAPPWVPNPATGANWIEHIKPFGPAYQPMPNAPPVYYKYKVLFNLDTALYRSIQVTGRFAVDNEKAIFKVSDSWIMYGGQFAAWTPFSIVRTAPSFAPFINGANSLEFGTTNLGGPEGLIVDTKLQATCREFDLTVRKSAVGAPWQVGGQETFNILVKNLGPDAISQGVIVMEDILPVGFQPPLIVTQQGSLWNCSTNPGPPAKVTCTWPANVQTVAPGPLPLITIKGTVGTLPLTNCATVSLTNSPIPDSKPSNDKSCVAVKKKIPDPPHDSDG